MVARAHDQPEIDGGGSQRWKKGAHREGIFGIITSPTLRF
jgi:hypothetical protein